MNVSDLLQSTSRWCRLTLDHFLIGLLVLEVSLLLSERFQWLSINEKKGYTVVITTSIVISAVILMLLWFLVSTLCRIRFRFKMRSLFVLVLVVAIPSCWLSSGIRDAKKQHEAIEAITNAGGMTFYHWQVGSPSAEPPGPVWLQSLLGVDFFSQVYGVQDGGSFAAWDFQDETMVYLKMFPELELLHVPSSAVTDTGLENLANLTQIRFLTLNSTGITDAGMMHIAKLPDLERLHLGQTQITDTGLEHLTVLHNLRTLSLFKTQVSDEGVAQFRKSLSSCEITR